MGSLLSALQSDREDTTSMSDSMDKPEASLSTQKRNNNDICETDTGICPKRACGSSDSCNSANSGQVQVSGQNAVRFLADRQLTGSSSQEILKCAETNVANKCTVEDRPVSNLTFDSLPQQIMIRIFSVLSVQDLLHRVSLVCRTWYNLAQDQDLWRQINVQGQVKVSNSILERLTSYSSNVCELNITDARLVTNTGVISVLEKCNTIKVLKMTRCQQLTDPAFIAIGRHLPRLQKLYLESCYGLSDQALAHIGAGCRQLQQLSISQCAKVSNEGITSIARSCPKLKQLSMDHCTRVSDTSLAVLADCCPDLEALCCMACTFTDQGLKECTKMHNLKVLQVPNINALTPHSIKAVSRCCLGLETLNVCLCQDIDDDCMDYVARHSPRLKSLHLVSCDISDKTLLSLASHSKQLEQLDVGWCKQVTDHGVQLLSSRCQSLRYLGLMRCDAITMATISQLMEQFPHITYSTMWLDYQRLLNRAQERGISMAT